VVPVIRTIIWEIFSVLGVLLAMAYVGLVLMGYTTEGPRYKSKFDTRRPAYSTMRLLIGLGVHFAIWLLRTADLILAPLFEAAAQVGDWINERSSPETRERFRSRFI
jgi:hypothetical protein